MIKGRVICDICGEEIENGHRYRIYHELVLGIVEHKVVHSYHREETLVDETSAPADDKRDDDGGTGAEDRGGKS